MDVISFDILQTSTCMDIFDDLSLPAGFESLLGYEKSEDLAGHFFGPPTGWFGCRTEAVFIIYTAMPDADFAS